MAYNTRFFYEFASSDGRQIQARILEDGFSGTASSFPLSPDGVPVTWGRRGAWMFTPILASHTSVPFQRLHGDTSVLDVVGGATWDRFRLQFYDVTNSQPLWYGRVLSDEFDTSTMNEPAVITIEAVDGLGNLKESDEPYLSDNTDPETGERLPYEGRATVVEVIARCLQRVGFGFGLSVRTAWHVHEELAEPLPAGHDPLSGYTIDQGVFFNEEEGKAASCYDVLRQCLTAFGCQLFQRNQRWHVVQRQLMGGAYTPVQYDATGAYVGAGDPVAAPSDTDPAPKHAGQKNFRSGFGQVTVNFNHGPVESLIQGTDLNTNLIVRRTRRSTDVSGVGTGADAYWDRYEPGLRERSSS